MSTATATVDSAREAAIVRVATYITDHPEASHTQQDLADLAAMNKRIFARMFVRNMGVGVKAFVRLVRVARARYLLDETDLSIAQVLRRSGFANADAGRRAFLAVERVAPTHYRVRGREATEE